MAEIDKASQKKLLERLEVSNVNPFMNKTGEFTLYERIKFIVALFTLIPIRLLLIIICLLTAAIVCKIALIGVSDEELKQPPTKSRNLVLRFLQYLGRFLLFICGYYWISVKGKPDPRATIIVPNHVSFIDPIFFLWATAPHFVAKKEAADVPLLGAVFRMIQPILVDRMSPNSRDDTSNEIIRRATWEGSPAWNPTVIFPEGTCTNGTVLISFKYGAFKSMTPVQPVVIRYPFINFDVSFVNGIGGTMLILRLLSQFVNFMEVEFLPLYTPSEKEKKNIALFANNVRTEMGIALNVPLTDHTYEDVLLQVEAMKRSVPVRQMVLAKSIKNQLSNLSYNELKDQLRVFAKLDKDNIGTLNLTQFRTALGLPDSKYVRELFSLLDVDENGTIDFREYIAGKALISQTLTTDETIRMAFASFDVNQDGVIEMHELKHVMQHGFPDINEEEVAALFNSIDRSDPDKVNFEEFSSHLKKNPEYLSIFMAYKKERATETLQQLAKEEKKDQ